MGLGVLKDFPTFNDITDIDRLTALQSIAFINVKKIAAEVRPITMN